MSQPLADPNQSLSDDVIALLRTVVPMLWGFAASFLINLGIPASVLLAVHGVAITGLTAVLAIAWYALWKWASPYVPQWLVALVLGYAANPTYQPIGSARAHHDEAPESQIPAPRTE